MFRDRTRTYKPLRGISPLCSPNCILRAQTSSVKTVFTDVFANFTTRNVCYYTLTLGANRPKFVSLFILLKENTAVSVVSFESE